jgi:hypothetical protein
MNIIALALSIIIPLTWYLGKSIDVYQFKLVGAFFEIIWLPMFAILFALPVISFVFWLKNKFSLRSLYFYSLLLSVISILLIVTSK